MQGIGSRAGFVGRAKYGGDGVAALRERLKLGFAEILLADDGDFHGVSAMSMQSGRYDSGFTSAIGIARLMLLE